MKRLIRPINATTEITHTDIMFTAEDIVNLLSKIEQLKGVNIFFQKQHNGVLRFTIGEDIYEIIK